MRPGIRFACVWRGSAPLLCAVRLGRYAGATWVGAGALDRPQIQFGGLTHGGEMGFMRLHWFDVGLGLAVVAGGWVLLAHPTGLALLLWLSLISLFVHQFEEYRYPGYFPGMMNVVLFSSSEPDRYPLNSQSALFVNVGVGWLFYGLAALLAEKALWLGIATLLISAGNVVVHTFLFNLRGRTWYNPGLLTADVLFLPLAAYFFYVTIGRHIATPLDWIVGIALGLVLNYVGILKLVDWLKDRHTPYVFPARFLLPTAPKSSRH